jgi:sugar phosphate isomerase/epimerase
VAAPTLGDEIGSTMAGLLPLPLHFEFAAAAAASCLCCLPLRYSKHTSTRTDTGGAQEWLHLREAVVGHPEGLLLGPPSHGAIEVVRAREVKQRVAHLHMSEVKLATEAEEYEDNKEEEVWRHTPLPWGRL